MKIIYLLFFFLTFSCNVTAQTEFPMENASWCYTAIGEKNIALYSICFSTDSLLEISGKTYARIRYKKDVFDTLNTIYYREEAKKFYVLPKDSINEILLCDFNLEVGDHFTFPKWGSYGNNTFEVTVHSVSTLTTNDGVVRKTISLSDSTGIYNAYWLEGFGNMFWIFLYPNYLGMLDNYFTFLCHTVNDKVVFSLTDDGDCPSINNSKRIPNKHLTIYPNPTNDYFSLKEFDNISKVSVYNLYGRQFEVSHEGNRINISNLESGIYYVVLKDTFQNRHLGKIVKL